MSVEYNAKFGLFQKPDLPGLVKEFVQAFPMVEHQESGQAFCFFTRGSIRGFYVRMEEKRKLNIRVNHFASESDAEMVMDFIGFLLEKGAVVRHEEGRLVRRGDLTRKHFEKELMGDVVLFDAMLLRADEKYVNLPLGDVDVTLWRTDYERLRESPQALRKHLQEKAWRLFHSRRASGYLLEKKYRMTIWLCDDMVTEPIDVIMLQNPKDEKDFFFVQWKDFAAQPGVYYETIPRQKEDVYYFVGGISAEDIEGLFSACRDVAFDLKQEQAT